MMKQRQIKKVAKSFGVAICWVFVKFNWFPDAQCMVYLPTFYSKTSQMYVNRPYIEHLGLSPLNDNYLFLGFLKQI